MRHLRVDSSSPKPLFFCFFIICSWCLFLTSSFVFVCVVCMLPVSVVSQEWWCVHETFSLRMKIKHLSKQGSIVFHHHELKSNTTEYGHVIRVGCEECREEKDMMKSPLSLFASFFLRTSNLVNQEKSLLWLFAVFSQNQQIVSGAVFVIIFVFIFSSFIFSLFAWFCWSDWFRLCFFASFLPLCLRSITACTFFVSLTAGVLCFIGTKQSRVLFFLIVRHAEGR